MRWLLAVAGIGAANGLRPSFDPIGLAARDAGRHSQLDTVRQPSREAAAIVSAAALATTMLPDAAVAKGGEYGLAEGRIISLAHPVAMGGCFLATLYAGYTGLQWRMLRELGARLLELDAQFP